MGNHRFLLDTDTFSQLVRDPHGKIFRRILHYGSDVICTSIVVSGELLYGAARSDSRKVRERVRAILNEIDVLPLQSPAGEHYAEIRAHLASTGNLIGPNDLFIAAQARANHCTLVSANLREFSRVPGLKCIDWTAA